MKATVKTKLIMLTKNGGWYVAPSTPEQKANGWGKLRFTFIPNNPKPKI